MAHSDQGSQFSSYYWQAFLKVHNLQLSMSRRGNCLDNAVAESFFQLLKRERIRRKIYATRDEARQDMFDYIEMFYNPKRRNSVSNRHSPVKYEKQYFERLASVQDFRVDSILLFDLDIFKSAGLNKYGHRRYNLDYIQ